jgi:hypothetical protein
LKEELEKSRKHRLHEINKKNDVIRKLKEELRDIKLQAEDATKKMSSRSKQKEDSDLQIFKDHETVLVSEITNLTSNLTDLELSNREIESQYRRRKFKIESEVENWISKYDQEMEEKQLEIDDISNLFEEERKALSVLQSKYDAMKQKYDVIMEERRLAEQKEREQKELLERQTKAAIVIQALVRGWQVRRAMKRSKEKRKSGKKKK